MPERACLVVLYDAPEGEDFDGWLHGPHYQDVLEKTPGVTAITRLEVMDPAPGQQRYMVLIETIDLEGTLAWRSSPEGQRSQRAVNEHGIHNRGGFQTRVIYEVRKS